MTALVIWITGLPASGKTTIANLLKSYYQKRNLPVEILDGDELRKTLSRDLGFSPEDRKEHNRRVIDAARKLSESGITTIVPVIAPYGETRDFARSQIQNFVEVWTKASLDECIRRDPKRLYKRALAGEIKNLTGLQAPYEEPKNPELIIDTEKHTPQECLEMLVTTLTKLGYLQ